MSTTVSATAQWAAGRLRMLRARWVCVLISCFTPISGRLPAGQENSAVKDKVRHFTVQAQTVIDGPASEPFNMPSDVAVGAEGDLYVLDGVNHRVVVFDADGEYRYTFGGHGSKPGQMIYPLGVATGPDGTVGVADSGNHRFQLFSRDGRLLQAVQLPGEGLNTPADPTDVAFDFARHRLYIADNDNHHINVFDLEAGTFEKPWGTPGLGERQFRFPFLMDTSPDGYLYVVEPINTRVQVLNPKGKFVSFVGNWGTKLGQLFRPKGVACMDDLIFVSDSYLGRIQVFDIQGEFLGVPLDLQQRPIKLTTPTGIAVDRVNRRLYVAELQANRVRRMDLSLESN